MARTETITVNGLDIGLQTPSLEWYLDNEYDCKDSSGVLKNKDYIDSMIKNCVTAPAELMQKGIRFFDEKDDFDTPIKLIREIDRFLKRPANYRKSKGQSPT